jgi:hypothetical protein
MTHKIPRVVGEKSIILVNNSRHPIWVFESTTNGLGDERWSGDGRSVEVEMLARGDDLAKLAAGDHLPPNRGRRS